MQELYGNKVAGDLLSAFSRLWTFYLQVNGFTCGIGDLLLTSLAETQRAELVEQAERRAMSASATYVGFSTDSILDVNDTSVSCAASQLAWTIRGTRSDQRSASRLHVKP